MEARRLTGYVRGWLQPAPKGERRFNKAFPGGWPARIGIVAFVMLFVGLGRADSWESALTGMAVLLAFYSSIMLIGWMNNYVSVGETHLTDSQMGMVTPGGPTYAGGKVNYLEITSVNLHDREVRVIYQGRDWRRRATTRTLKFKLEEPEAFAEALVAAVRSSTHRDLWIGREI